MKSIAIAVAAATLSLASFANAGNLVVNGDFTQLSNGLGQFDSNTTVTGWSGNGGYNFVFNTADQAVNGVYGGLALWDQADGGSNTWDGKTATGAGNFAAMDGDFGTAAITQVVNGLHRRASLHALVQLRLRPTGRLQRPDDPKPRRQHRLDHLELGNNNVGDHGFTGWQHEALGFTATSASETLSFLAHGNLPVPPFAMVSTVSIPGVPEPATWTLMILGVGAMGGLARRRRMAAVAA